MPKNRGVLPSEDQAVGSHESLLEARIDLAVQGAADYLLENRAANRVAWGLLRNDDPDLHYSSLALAALARTGLAQTSEMVRAFCEDYLVEGYASYEFRALPREPLMAIVRLTAVAEDVLGPDTATPAGSALLRTLKRMRSRASTNLLQHVRGEMQDVRENPKEVAKVLLVTGLYIQGRDRRELDELLINALSRSMIEEGEIGWWTSGRGREQPDIVGTSLALLSLTHGDNDARLRPIEMSSKFLVQKFIPEIWDEIFIDRYIYGQSVVVRAFSTINDAATGSLDNLERSCSRLCALQAPDGSWGDDVEVGNIEATSHALISLIEARNRLFGAVHDPIRRLSEPTGSAEDSDDEVIRILRTLVEASDKSARVLTDLERDVAALRAELGARQTDDDEYELSRAERWLALRRSVGLKYSRDFERRNVALIVASSLTFTIVSGIALAFDITRTFGLVWTIALGGLAVSALVGVLAAVYYRGVVSPLSTTVARTSVLPSVREFWSASEGMSRHRIDRLLLTVERNLADLPQDLFLDELRQLVTAEDLQDVRLIEWLRGLASLRPIERKEVLWAIARGIRR